MPHWLACTLTGRHDYRVSCSDGAIFLRCVKCGRQSPGWQLSNRGSAADRPSERRHELPAVPRVTRLSPAGE